ncbi:MAG TPA: ATP cone domain-containing protein, partial [Eubacteriales bacterium]|nr:ATP cone domain-containing protein [Eubacteriales bacterium]
MIIKILKRDGRVEFFDKEKIVNAIFSAARACGGRDRALSERLADMVVKAAEAKYVDTIPTVEDIQDL